MRQEGGILQGAFEAASHCRRIGKQHKMLMVTSKLTTFLKNVFFFNFFVICLGRPIPLWKHGDFP